MSAPSYQPSYWADSTASLLSQLQSTAQGISNPQARLRIMNPGARRPRQRRSLVALRLLLTQFQSPLILLLLFAATLSFALHDQAGGIIIFGIVLVSGALGFWQEQGAANAVEKLLALVQVKATVLRDAVPVEVPASEVVVGDVLLLRAGDRVSGDSRLLEAKDLYVNEAALTGETFPVEKVVGVLPTDTPLGSRKNCVFMGTNVISGTATALVARTGADTEFGQVSTHLKNAPPETEFEAGIRHFGYLLMEVTLVLVLGIFATNVYFRRPVLDSLLFALALAVGLTPQLLPAIISVNLAHGAKRMAARKVIVKRLAAIENFGSMNVFCSDKTGTLTEGQVQVQGTLDLSGNPSDKVRLYAYLNAIFESGFLNPIDEAIRALAPPDITAFHKIDELPYDFSRKRLSILVAAGQELLLVTKGALSNVLDVCVAAESDGEMVPLDDVRQRIETQYESFSQQGLRTLGVAYRRIDPEQHSAVPRDAEPQSAGCLRANHEAEMTFAGFLVLADPPKTGIADTIGDLRALGITLKIITGDNRLVAAHIGHQVGLEGTRLLVGPELGAMSNEALAQRVQETSIFAEIEPNQKERIIFALRKAGNVVGYMGDGINDASALHSADVGISVASAVDIAKEAADIVLLEPDLDVLVQGVREGRVTFANTLKYVFMATSANFGNMCSMAGASLFLPFLPLLPKQILLTNLLTDLPEMTIASDVVDAEMVRKPRRWDIAFIRRFMLTFGLLSSVFDYLTFAVLRLMLHAGPTEFRTGWFVESVISASLIVLVIRTRRPFFRSLPGRSLLAVTFLTLGLALSLPFTPLGPLFGFSALPLSFALPLGGILFLYVSSAELAKYFFYQPFNSRT